MPFFLKPLEVRFSVFVCLFFMSQRDLNNTAGKLGQALDCLFLDKKKGTRLSLWIRRKGQHPPAGKRNESQVGTGKKLTCILVGGSQTVMNGLRI